VSKASPPADATSRIAERIEELSRLQHPPEHPFPNWLDQELTFSQLRVLYLLAERGPKTMSSLADALQVTPATATGVVERLEKRGLAVRSHRGDDRRVVECGLTNDGEQMVRSATGARLDLMRQWLSVLTPDELTLLDGLLTSAITRLAAAQQQRSPAG
jgi:MarR family transcriptional regulator, organic hydroperoxide resistance regulator